MHEQPRRLADLAQARKQRFQTLFVIWLVVDKWFSLQATVPEPGARDKVRSLTAHPAFSLANRTAFVSGTRCSSLDPRANTS